MIKQLSGIEILDSRGRPTVKATCVLDNGITGTASVPSGASTGKAEALELRDGDKRRFGGYGCKKAVACINTLIHGAVSGKEWETQEAFDRKMIRIDGTADKHHLGANAILACSLAFARAQAKKKGIQLFQYCGEIIHRQNFQIPRPTVNLFSGGKHAGGQVPVQDLLIIPLKARTLNEALAQVYEVYQSASSWILQKYGMRALKADEGGLAPGFRSVQEMMEDAIVSIEETGLKPGRDISLALDVASSHFYRNEKYYFGDRELDSEEMIHLIQSWVKDYPILSVEDGLAENDWDYWPSLRSAIENKCLVLGDDLLCTRTDRIQRAVAENAANALLLKVNQCGTLTEAAEAFRLATESGWQVTVSARSGETEDNWLADLAVGWCGNQIKIGSLTQSDRLSKYNRMLELETLEGLSMRKWIFPK